MRSLLQEHAKAGASLEELAAALDVEHISAHLYTRGQPDPDLVIRTPMHRSTSQQYHRTARA